MYNNDNQNLHLCKKWIKKQDKMKIGNTLYHILALVFIAEPCIIENDIYENKP